MERPKTPEADDLTWRNRLQGAAARIGRFLGKGMEPIEMKVGEDAAAQIPDVTQEQVAARHAQLRARTDELQDQGN